jgi:MFS family permease
VTLENPTKIKRNTLVVYAIYFFTGLIFWYGIEKLFITKYLHLGPSAIAYIIIVYGLIQIFFNIPTGALADKWSRKGMIIVSLLILFASTYILGTSNSLTQYLIGTFGWGLYLVCFNGTLESLLYDSLKQRGVAGTYKKIYGRSQAFFMLGVFISSSASGFMANSFGIRSPYFITLASVVVAIAVSLLLIEPEFHKRRVSNKAIAHMVEAITMIKKSSVLIQIVIMSTVLFLVQTTYYEYAQLFYIAIFSASAIATGLSNGMGALSIAVGSLLPKYVKISGFGFIVMAILLFASMSPNNHFIRIGLFMMFGLVYGIVSANINDLKHTKIPSHIRATLSSAISTVDYIIVIPVVLLFSKLISEFSIFWAFRAVAISALIFGLYYLLHGKKIITNKPANIKELD